MLRVDIFSLFPEMFVGPLDSSMLKRAVNQGLVNFNIHNIRDYTHDKHHTADDYSYGGGAGMVMKAEPVFEAVETVRQKAIEMADCQPSRDFDDSSRTSVQSGNCRRAEFGIVVDVYLRTLRRH